MKRNSRSITDEEVVVVREQLKDLLYICTPSDLSMAQQNINAIINTRIRPGMTVKTRVDALVAKLTEEGKWPVDKGKMTVREKEVGEKEIGEKEVAKEPDIYDKKFQKNTKVLIQLVTMTAIQQLSSAGYVEASMFLLEKLL